MGRSNIVTFITLACSLKYKTCARQRFVVSLVVQVSPQAITAPSPSHHNHRGWLNVHPSDGRYG
ncbi:hypothetical protein ALC62_00355 [Cyphomyrmex costatus]|uniref:Uncharacterized protein n=1 Tax=Cyphomyrmex costatus TaxID=456900 RepID=A0A195D8B6_9HYME|nr:hypothetical protein ALC62_00355 [Cyphomyrmex costatus]